MPKSGFIYWKQLEEKLLALNEDEQSYQWKISLILFDIKFSKTTRGKGHDQGFRTGERSKSSEKV